MLRRRARHRHPDPAGLATLPRTRLVPLAAVLALAFPAGASAAVETATVGDVHAELSYEKADDDFSYRDVRLKIVRAGSTLLDKPVPAPCRECPTIPAAPETGDSLIINDLEGDGEPEVVVDLFTGGAHCCTFAQIYRYRGTTGDYARTKHEWRDSGYTLRDLDGDAKPEFHSYDARFAFEFTAYAFSVFPVQIWRYRDGVMTDVTRRFRGELRRDARTNKRLYLRTRDNPDADIRGVLAAYLADKYLLRQGRSGWLLVRRAVRRGEVRKLDRFDSNPAGRSYLRRLRRFLKRTGYIR